jgi:hypothetical protein
MLPQWPRVVWATTLQFPSKGAAIAEGAEQMIAEAAVRAMAQIRLPIMEVPLGWFRGSICPLKALHSITSSARASQLAALAVFRMMTNSYLVGALHRQVGGLLARMRST